MSKPFRTSAYCAPDKSFLCVCSCFGVFCPGTWRLKGHSFIQPCAWITKKNDNIVHLEPWSGSNFWPWQPVAFPCHFKQIEMLKNKKLNAFAHDSSSKKCSASVCLDFWTCGGSHLPLPTNTTNMIACSQHEHISWCFICVWLFVYVFEKDAFLF